MQESGEMMEINEHLTDVEIMRAVRYLDPDVCAERTRKNAGTFVGICIALLTGLMSAITYICLYMRKL